MIFLTGCLFCTDCFYQSLFPFNSCKAPSVFPSSQSGRWPGVELAFLLISCIDNLSGGRNKNQRWCFLFVTVGNRILILELLFEKIFKIGSYKPSCSFYSDKCQVSQCRSFLIKGIIHLCLFFLQSERRDVTQPTQAQRKEILFLCCPECPVSIMRDRICAPVKICFKDLELNV